MAKVDVNETLLKKYSDKELIKYITSELKNVLSSQIVEDISDEAKMAIRLMKIGELYRLLALVDNRMNGSNKDVRVMV